MRDGEEAEHRGYDVVAGKRDVNFYSMDGYVESLRFEPRNGEEVGNLVTSDPGDPKIITMDFGSMAVSVAALVGNSRAYEAAHGKDPRELVLSEKALERRQAIVDELVPIFESDMTEAGEGEMCRLRSSYEEKIVLELGGITNKFGMGHGTKTFKGGENLLNEAQDVFVFKRDEYICQLEALVLDALRPKLVEKGLLKEGERLCINFHSEGTDIFAEVNMPRAVLES